MSVLTMVLDRLRRTPPHPTPTLDDVLHVLDEHVAAQSAVAARMARIVAQVHQCSAEREAMFAARRIRVIASSGAAFYVEIGGSRARVLLLATGWVDLSSDTHYHSVRWDASETDAEAALGLLGAAITFLTKEGAYGDL